MALNKIDKILNFLCIVLIILFINLLKYITKLDYNLSYLPYNQLTNKFYGENHWWCLLIYYSVPCIVVIIILSNLWILYAGSLKLININFNRRFASITLCSLLIGPGLISNELLKSYWGRARPYQVIRDKLPFQAFYQSDFGNQKNNSFPSGHSSIGFFIGSLCLIFRRKYLGLLLSFVLGGIVGMVRILQGGHYLTDVIFSFIIVWLVTQLTVYAYDKFVSC